MDFFQKSDGLVMSLNGILERVTEWNSEVFHGMECWEGSWNGMLGRFV